MYKNFLLTLWALLPCIFASTLPDSCADAVRISGRRGVHLIQLTPINGAKSGPFYVFCELDPHNGDAWTVIQRRVDKHIDFQRNWTDYKSGFGDLNTNFWLGLERIHALTLNSLHELWIKLEDFDKGFVWAKYDHFAIGNEEQYYAMIVLGTYVKTSTAGNSLISHRGMQFSTYDEKHNSGDKECGSLFGGWWFRNCGDSNLNGAYIKPGEEWRHVDGAGVIWEDFRGLNYSLKYARMAIRKKGCINNRNKKFL